MSLGGNEGHLGARPSPSVGCKVKAVPGPHISVTLRSLCSLDFSQASLSLEEGDSMQAPPTGECLCPWESGHLSLGLLWPHTGHSPSLGYSPLVHPRDKMFSKGWALSF